MRYIAFSASVEYIFSPPFPGCRMQLSMLYIRGTSIFSTYGHVHTFIRTYLFFVDTRRHCCELNATRYEIPRLQFALRPRTEATWSGHWHPVIILFPHISYRAQHFCPCIVADNRAGQPASRFATREFDSSRPFVIHAVEKKKRS